MPFEASSVEDLARVEAEARKLGFTNGSEAKTSNRTSTPTVLSVSQVLAANIAMPEMLVESLVSRPGLTLVVAPHKTGKTLLTLQIALSVASETRVCEYYRVVKPGPVLFVEKDDPGGLASIKDVLRRSPRDLSGVALYTVTDSELTFGADFILWLDTQITSRGLRLVVLDSYTALRGARTSSGDLVKAEASELTVLDQLAKKHGISILLIHHYSKGSVNHDWSERAAGTFAMGAASEAQIVLTRFADDNSNGLDRLLRVRGRHLAGTDAVIRLDPETLTFDHMLEGPAASHWTELHQINEAFGQASFSPKNLSHEFGIAIATAHRLIRKLSNASAIERAAYGEYRLEDHLIECLRRSS